MSTPNPRKVIMLTAGRTGKTHLLSMLNKHPDLHFHDEPLTKLISGGSDAQFDWLNRDFFADAGEAECIGMATKVRSLIDEDRFRSWILRNNAQVCYMGRRNIVKLVISEVRALQLNRTAKTYNARSKDEVLASTSIDPLEFHHYFTQRLGFEARLLNFIDTLRPTVPILEFHYEDLLSRQQQTMDLLFTYMALEPMDGLASDVHKNTSNTLRDSVENLDELILLYKGTRYEPLFEQ